MHQRLDLRLEKTMKRLELLLQRRFGSQLKVVLDGHGPAGKDQSQGLPIEWNKTKLGYVDLANVQLTERDRKMLDDTLDLIVPSLLKGYDDIEALMRIEERSLYMDQRRTEDSQVVDMQSFFRKKITSGLPRPVEQKWVLDTPFLIESRFISDITRMALEIHARTQRFAFLYWHEIDTPYRQQSHSLLQMGNCTLFVPEIINLPKEEQLGLLHLMELAKGNNHPLVIAGTARSYMDLLSNPDVNQDFLRKLSKAHLKMEKPYKEYAKSGLLQFVMNGLSSKNLAY